MIEIFAERLSALRKAEGLSVNGIGEKSSHIQQYDQPL